MIYFLTFIMGALSTYIITIISSTIRAAAILEQANKTLALALIAGYETSLEQVELMIANNGLNEIQADNIRDRAKKSFEQYANKKIDFMVKNIPDSHLNILRYRNFHELKSYVIKLDAKTKGRRK